MTLGACKSSRDTKRRRMATKKDDRAEVWGIIIKGRGFEK